MVTVHYRRPTTLSKWTNDIAGGELYELLVLDDGTVCATSGRYAHSSGSTSCTWYEFIRGEMQLLVASTLGKSVLDDAIKFVAAISSERTE